MYKLVIVDDEDVILNNMTQSFDWESMGFDLVGSFTDAASLLDYLKQNHVDVVITDIKMPQVSGVELAQKINELYPDILIVFLSGYKDFEYAVKGIQIGVFSYLLKPLAYADVEELCKNLRETLKKRYLSANSDVSFKEIVPVAFQKAISDYLFKNNKNTSKIVELFKTINVDLTVSPITIIDITLDCFEDYLVNSWHYEKNRLYSAVNYLAISDKIVLIPLTYTFDKIQYLAISKTCDLSQFSNEIIAFKTTFTQNCLDILNLVTILSIGRISIGIESFVKTEEYIKQAKAESNLLFKLIESGKSDKAVERVMEIISTYSENINYLNAFAYELYCHLANCMSYEDFIKYNIYPKEIEFPVKMDMYNMPVDIDKMVNYLVSTVKNAALYFSGNFSIDNALIEKVIKYIDKHYMENLSLADIASSVYLSEYHFCRYFKKKMNMNFIDYLNKVRIEHSQKLLSETNFKINEICNMVGYSSLKYFYKKFKSQTGTTPREYRNMILSSKNE